MRTLKIELPDNDVIDGFLPNSKPEFFWHGGKKYGNIDIPFLVLTLIVLVIGLVTLFSASHAYAYYNRGDSYYYIQRQLVWAAAGVIAMMVISQLNFKWIEKWAAVVFAGSVVLLIIAVLFMRNSRGFARWIYIGNFSFQPSEVAKFAIILLFAHMAATYREKMSQRKYGLWPFIVCLGLVCGLVLLERHLSGTIIIGLIGVSMMFFGGSNLRFFLIALGIIAVGALIIVLIPYTMEYATARVQSWMDPYADAKGEGYQTIQSLIAIGSGGLFGTGIGNSKQKYLYIPEPQNDFIFAVGCEELGFVGATFILLLFALLIWRGFAIARNCSDHFGSLLAAGCTMHVGMQVLFNIAVVTNTIPNTGISLPFFSYGGTALMMTLGEMGIVLSVSKKSRLSNPVKAGENQ